ncbi:MAG: SpoIIE family protein phosphatase [Sphingobacteriaceae bacterium]|nr:SpoIIE family protein phosphatase [Sphingobacteriaceae bacterium]
MQKQLLKLISVGVRSTYDKDTVEKTKLVNGISLMGVPISLFYAILFALSGYYFHASVFLIGIAAFSITLLCNKYFGFKFARVYISIAAPLCFGLVNLISGKDAGFYMGFIVTIMPAVLIFENAKQWAIVIVGSLMILGLSIVGYNYYPPIADAKFTMLVHMINLITVIMAALSVVLIFKRELNESREKIEEKQKEILDSIHYAKKIQNTLIAHKSFIDENISDNFVVFQPKDIVSGDFYWATKHGERFYLAVCDSTGHGVPGAFMSLLNITFLNEAINEKYILEVDEVFNYARKKLIENLGKEGQKDGFDCILLCMDKAKNELTYAAANNSPVIISDGKLRKLPCCKMPVGQGEKKDPFVRYKIDSKPKDLLYLYTDGFADQFGGPKGKKFKYKELNDLILKNSQMQLEQQSNKLLNQFFSWKGDLEQVDDVLIIGMRL